VVNPQNFADFVKMDFGVSPVKLISAERKDASLLSEALESAVNTKTICIAVGAEGGFTEAEFALSFAHGFKPVGLGKRILRAETAAIYSASIVASRLDR
jgi:16S rRNA (uracil1498-N3)-methyltransferase